MNKRLCFKLVIDLTMFILFLLLMSYPLTQQYVHELVGVFFAIVLFIHNLLNWRWYRSIIKGKYNVIRLLHTLVNLLIIFIILINVISALGISLWQFVFLSIDWGMTGRQLHILSAYWGMILLAIHIGFHWDMLMGIARKMTGVSTTNIKRTNILRALAIALAIYGGYVTDKLDIGARLIAYYSYFFIDESQWLIVLMFDYFAFFSLWIMLTHYGLKLLRDNKAKPIKTKP